MLTALLRSCSIVPVGVGMSLAAVQRLLRVDVVGLVTSDGMRDEYAKCDCGGISATSLHVSGGRRQLT